MAEKVGPFGVHSRQNSYPYYQCSFDDRRERILERVFLLSSVISHHSSLFLLGCSGVLAVNHTSCSRSCLAVYLIPRSPLIIIPLSKHLCLYLYVAIDSDRFFRSPWTNLESNFSKDYRSYRVCWRLVFSKLFQRNIKENEFHRINN